MAPGALVTLDKSPLRATAGVAFRYVIRLKGFVFDGSG
jgi:hypothetical protein